ncbi:F-box/LRR-repeat protein 6 [Erythrolamprus reginae]|uniref:F-box/LRR-repeat protein 6 n=1 Tax=Erythrolamprus reginae TaxID=121349 RepID=UPI00396D0064
MAFEAPPQPRLPGRGSPAPQRRPPPSSPPALPEPAAAGAVYPGGVAPFPASSALAPPVPSRPPPRLPPLPWGFWGAEPAAMRPGRGGGAGPPPRKRRRRRRGVGRGSPGGEAGRFRVQATAEALVLVPAEGAAEEARGPPRRRRGRAAEAGGDSPGGAGGGWGSRLPAELLVRILGLAVAEDGGAVPLLCRAACVCRLWQRAASVAGLWRTVAVGHCWGAPGQKWGPAQQKKALGTLQWLAEHRFSLLRDFTLSHWKSLVPSVLQALAASSPQLASLHLSHCSGVTAEPLGLLAISCPHLESLDLQGSQVDPWTVTGFLEMAGARMKQLSLTYSSRISAIFALLVSGCCPELRLLEVNAEIKQNTQHFQLPIEQLQAACPQLQVLRLLNITYYPKQLPASSGLCPGFPQLEELCLATTAFSFVDNHMLWRILTTSRRLRVLDLRGCIRVTPKGLEQLTCPDLEQLYLGLHYSDSHLSRPLEGSPLLTWKWRHSLRELDLTSQSFSEEDLDQAMAAFTQGVAPLLRSLSLTGTKVALRTVRTLIASCPALVYLNLSSCRHLPRGTKKAYRGPGEIRQCLRQLSASSEDSETPGWAV